MTIYLGGDHAGFELKKAVSAALLEDGHTVRDLGNTAYDEGDDYPPFAKAVADAVTKNKTFRGIVFCGNAEGVCIVANKVDGVRAGIGFSAEAARRAPNNTDTIVFVFRGGC